MREFFRTDSENPGPKRRIAAAAAPVNSFDATQIDAGNGFERRRSFFFFRDP